MHKILLPIILTLGISTGSLVFAQDQEPAAPKTSKHNIGAAAGFVTGYGLSYRLWLGKSLGLQFTTAPFYRKDKDVTRTSLSLGFTVLKSLFKGEHTRLLGYSGIAGHYLFQDFDETRPGFDPLDDGDEEEYNINFGLGPGIELTVWQLSFNLMGGLACYKSNDSFSVSMTGEVGLYYMF